MSTSSVGAASKADFRWQIAGHESSMIQGFSKLGAGHCLKAAPITSS
jgi:hypothetical protein